MVATAELVDNMSDAEQEAHARAIGASPADIAVYLQRLLGQKVTADIAGTRDPKGVGRWARQEQEPRGAAVARMRNAYQTALLLESTYPPKTVRAWFLQMNPYLDFRAPASRIPIDPESVYRAARAFVLGY
jgi:hypothetical protein